MKLVFKLSIIAIFCTTLYTPLDLVKAQIPTSADGINIQFSPSNPSPNQTTEVSIESYSIDLSTASILWLVDGKTKDQGIGVKKVAVSAPKTGISMNIQAVIKAVNGIEIKKSIVLKSNSIDMIWEPLGYIPPFFDGKGALAYQNSVKVVAFPHISKDGGETEVDPKNLVYKWKSGGKYIEDGQGYGKQSVTIQTGIIPKPVDVSVEISTQDQKDNVFGSINITPTEPSVSFYEESSLYGILFNKALLGNVYMKNNEMGIRAVTYNFNTNTMNKNSYVWSINNIERSDLSENQSIILRTSGDREGTSNIGLDIRNTQDILQGAKGGFSIYFNKKSVGSGQETVF